MWYCWRWISSGVGCSYTRAGVGRCELSALPVVFYWPVRRNLQKKVKKKKKGKTEKANGLAENPANLVER